METFEAIAVFLFLLAALALGWHFGTRFGVQPPRTRKFQPDYFIGLNYLLNDEPDDAVDVFIEALEVNAGTLETHMALATLLRRRGKVDRAISHLQGLLSSQSFTVRELAAIKVQLVRSYIAAGLFDRAERIVEELREAPGGLREQGLALALTLFQTEKEWQKAIDSGLALLSAPGLLNAEAVQLQVSHFYCELADEAQRDRHYDRALDLLHKGGAICPDNIRVLLQQASLQAEMKHDERAEQYLRHALRLDATLVLEKLSSLTGLLARRPRLLDAILQEVLRHEQNLDARQVELIASLLDRYQGSEREIGFLANFARRHPSQALALRLLRLATSDLAAGQAPSLVNHAMSVLDDSQQEVAQFRCRSCGFQLRTMHWLCPGCGGWSTIAPAQP